MNKYINNIFIVIFNNYTNIFLLLITILNCFIFITKRHLTKHGHIQATKFTISKNKFVYFYLIGILSFPLKILLKYLFIKYIKRGPNWLIKFIANPKLKKFRNLLFEINNYWYLIHLIRRFIESKFLFCYSSYSKMHLLHLFLGLSYYLFLTFYISTLPSLNNNSLIIFIIIQLAQFFSHLLVFKVIKIRRLRVLKLKIFRKFNLENYRSLIYKFPYYFEFLLYFILWSHFAKYELFLNLLWILSVILINSFNK